MSDVNDNLFIDSVDDSDEDALYSSSSSSNKISNSESKAQENTKGSINFHHFLVLIPHDLDLL